MEDERKGDMRVPLVFSFFCLCLTAGGVLLVFYVFVPSISRPWFPSAAFVLIASPWVFWFFTYLYTCVKGCFGSGAAQDVRQISRRPTTRNASSFAMQSSNQQGGAQEPSVASSKEPEMPLTYSV